MSHVTSRDVKVMLFRCLYNRYGWDPSWIFQPRPSSLRVQDRPLLQTVYLTHFVPSISRPLGSGELQEKFKWTIQNASSERYRNLKLDGLGWKIQDWLYWTARRDENVWNPKNWNWTVYENLFFQSNHFAPWESSIIQIKIFDLDTF